MENKGTWLYPTAQELAHKTIRIENTGLQPIFFTVVSDAETGQCIGNITRIQIDTNADSTGGMHITAKVTLTDRSQSQMQRRFVEEEITLENPLLKIDAEVTEIEMRWRTDE
ncbi:MAG: hypothetical protein ACR2H5_23875 [Ktedonobacteraceae bacterium]